MERPSKVWESFIHDCGSAKKAQKDATKTYFEKYTKGSNAGEIEYRGEPFKAGTIYCFVYVNEKRDNTRPLFLSMGGFIQDHKYMETGIDLQLVPPKFREFILDRFFDVHQAQLNENEELAGKGQRTKPLNFTWSDAVLQLGRCGWQSAATSFDRAKIRQVSIVDYSDWSSLIGMQTGAMKNTAKTYAEYVKKAQHKLEAEPSWNKPQKVEIPKWKTEKASKK